MTFENGPRITVPYRDLLAFLNEAEKRQRLREPASGQDVVGKTSGRSATKRENTSVEFSCRGNHHLIVPSAGLSRETREIGNEHRREANSSNLL